MNPSFVRRFNTVRMPDPSRNIGAGKRCHIHLEPSAGPCSDIDGFVQVAGLFSDGCMIPILMLELVITGPPGGHFRTC